MASSSASVPHNQQISEKLTRENHILWKAQVLLPIRGAMLAGYLDGLLTPPAATITVTTDSGSQETINPAYAQWVAQDQQVLGFLLNSLSKEVLTQVASIATAVQLWAALEQMFSSQSRARIINIRMAMANMQKGNMTAAEYFSKMRALADELASAGKQVDDDDLVSYLLAGLDIDYNPLVASVLGRSAADPITINDLYGQLLSYDTRMEMLHHSGAGGPGLQVNNAARRGRIGSGQRGRGGSRGGRGSYRGVRGHGPRYGPGGGRGNQGASSDGGRGNQGGSSTVCQICSKPNHTAQDCWYRFDSNYVPNEGHHAG